MNFKDATQIGITLQRFILYTLASLSSDNNPTNFSNSNWYHASKVYPIYLSIT